MTSRTAGYPEPVSALAVSTASIIVGIAVVVGVVFLVLLIVAPWKSVRAEPPLDEEVETRLLLGEDPKQIAADEDAEDARLAPVRDLDGDREPDQDAAATLADLANLNDVDELADGNSA
jgi:hypothetical protein